MRICIVVNTFPAVSETFIINKVAGLAARGHKIHVVCSDKKSNEDLFMRYDLGSPNIKVHTLRIEKKLADLIINFINTPSLLFKSFSINPTTFAQKYVYNYQLGFFKRLRCDIIHFEFSGIGVSFLPIIDALRGKKVVSCRGTAEKVKPLVDEKRKTLITKLFYKVDAIHCVSDDMAKTIEPYVSNASKVFINRPAIDVSFFNGTPSYEKKEKFQLLSVGRLSYAKGYVTGLLVVRDLVAKGYDVNLNIIGDGPQMEEVIFHINQMKITGHVTLLGRRNRDAVRAFCEQADVFLLTSYFEGLPNVALEAMAMQLPVVSTKCGGVEEAIEHGVDGFIADVYDHTKLTEYVAALLDNPELRRKIGNAAKQKVVNEFTLQRQLDVFENEYKKLL